MNRVGYAPAVRTTVKKCNPRAGAAFLDNHNENGTLYAVQWTPAFHHTTTITLLRVLAWVVRITSVIRRRRRLPERRTVYVHTTVSEFHVDAEPYPFTYVYPRPVRTISGGCRGGQCARVGNIPDENNNVYETKADDLKSKYARPGPGLVLDWNNAGRRGSPNSSISFFLYSSPLAHKSPRAFQVHRTTHQLFTKRYFFVIPY